MGDSRSMKRGKFEYPPPAQQQPSYDPYGQQPQPPFGQPPVPLTQYMGPYDPYPDPSAQYQQPQQQDPALYAQQYAQQYALQYQQQQQVPAYDPYAYMMQQQIAGKHQSGPIGTDKNVCFDFMNKVNSS